MFDKELLRILRCPMGKSELRLENDHLVCIQCGPKFSIQDGIPVMLIEEAELPDGCSNPEQLPCIIENTNKNGTH